MNKNKKELRLEELEPGQKGKVIKITAKGALKRRLLEIGIIKGIEIEVERFAPLGDPIELKIKDFHLSLRKEEAKNIYVEIINEK